MVIYEVKIFTHTMVYVLACLVVSPQHPSLRMAITQFVCAVTSKTSLDITGSGQWVIDKLS